MSVFARAIDALFRDRNIAADATWYPAKGRPVAVRVIRSQAPLDGPLAGAGAFRLSPSAQADAAAFEVRVSEVEEPARGDKLVVGGKSYEVRERALVDDGLVWRLTVGAAEAA